MSKKLNIYRQIEKVIVEKPYLSKFASFSKIIFSDCSESIFFKLIRDGLTREIEWYNPIKG